MEKSGRWGKNARRGNPLNVPSFFIRSGMSIRRKRTKIPSPCPLPAICSFCIVPYSPLCDTFARARVFILKCKIQGMGHASCVDCRKRGRGNLIRNKDEILEKFHRPLCITVPQRVCQAGMFFSYQILLDRLIRKIGESIFLAQATAAYAPMEDASNIFEVSAFRQHDANKIPGNFTSIFEY